MLHPKRNRCHTTISQQRSLFEIIARVNTDPILNNYLTQTMENKARSSGVRRLQAAEMSFIFIFSTVVRMESVVFKSLINVQTT